LSISAIPVRRVDEGLKETKTWKHIQGDKTMKFIMLVRHPENAGHPPKELMDAIAILSQESANDGSLLSSGGLAPVAQSTHVRVSNGKLTVTDGPFTEAKEVIGGFAQFELGSKEDAVKGAVRFMELHRKHWPGYVGETEIRQIYGPEDFARLSKERLETRTA
jgi:hypothetical protein